MSRLTVCKPFVPSFRPCLAVSLHRRRYVSPNGLRQHRPSVDHFPQIGVKITGNASFCTG
jgi:hypothetical protein